MSCASVHSIDCSAQSGYLIGDLFLGSPRGACGFVEDVSNSEQLSSMQLYRC